jgi:hypothetical protein
MGLISSVLTAQCCSSLLQLIAAARCSSSLLQLVAAARCSSSLQQLVAAARCSSSLQQLVAAAFLSDNRKPFWTKIPDLSVRQKSSTNIRDIYRIVAIRDHQEDHVL